MVLLHLWMVLRRLRPVPGGEGRSQALFDHFCGDMDANLREMGVGDLTVPKRMHKFGEAFYGRSAAYDTAFDMDLEAGGEALAQALCRNVLDGRGIEQARRLAAYANAVIAALAGLDDTAVGSASWQFPPPAPFAVVA
jgi:cytochrome b pre-mRNA-processing protein 3